jgi:hypothetical protein
VSVKEDRDYSPAVYGSLLVTTLLVVQWRDDGVPELIAFTLVSSVAVFWLMHVWSEVVNHRLHGPIASADAVAIARHEASILAAAVVPAAVLVGAQFLGVDANTTIGLGLVVSIGQLFVWGLVVGFAVHSSPVVAFGIALVDCSLGILIIGLKVLILH